jgi:hypothetical protein
VATEAARLNGKDRNTKEKELFTLDGDRPSHGRSYAAVPVFLRVVFAFVMMVLSMAASLLVRGLPLSITAVSSL